MTDTSIVMHLDQAELACRMLEAMIETKRPDGKSPMQALSHVDEDTRAGLLRAAHAAIGFFAEQTRDAFGVTGVLLTKVTAH